MLKFVYSLFIGILLATTIGVGISAFYTAPEFPEYPEAVKYSESGTPAPDDEAKLAEYEAKQKQYEATSSIYNRNVALIAIGFSIVILVLSLVVLSNVAVIADGMLLGGLLTLLYGVARSFFSGQQKFIFLTVLVGLIAGLIVGYFKFIKPEAKAK